MKSKILITVFAALLFGLIACKKDDNAPIPSVLEASNTDNIKVGETVSFTFSQAPEQSPVIWSVSPDNNVQLDASGNKASFIFGHAGNYSIEAKYGELRGSLDVIVNDSTFIPGDPIYEPLTGDQIFITVARYDSMAVSGLDFSYITEKKYNCLNHTLVFDNIWTGQDLTVDFKSVYIPSEEFCTPGLDHASGGTAWYPVEEGQHGFVVVLDGQTYTGSFIKSGSTYTFTWPYTSGVTITPLVIN